MNKSYKSVWNESTGSWVAVSELATGRSKSKRAKTAISKAILTQIAVGGMSLAGAGVAMADDSVKVGNNATVNNVADGVAIGVNSEVDADTLNPSKIGGVAIGDSAYAIGSGVAVGQNSQAGSDSMAFGSGAAAQNGGTAIGANSYSINNGGVAIGQNATATGAGAMALGKNSSATASGAVAIGQDSVASGMNTVSVGNATTQRQITNLAAGVNATDAVNVGQLTAAGLVVNSSGVAQNSFVAYDAGSAKALITLQGASGTKITNVLAGTVSSSSKDAINGSQLYNAEASVAAVLGGSAGVNADGTIKAPTYKINNNNYTSLDSALAAAAATGSSGGGTDAQAVHYTDANQTTVSLGNGSTAVALKNVAAGTTSTDAVNLAQLNAATNGLDGAVSTLKYIAVSSNSTGSQAFASGKDALAVGGSSFAMGDGALAFGTNARAQGVNAVAVGTGSTASKDNTFSIGNVGAERRLVNVAVGTGNTDAVNLGQVKQLIAASGTVSSNGLLQSGATNTGLLKAGATNLLTATTTSSLTPDALIASGPTDKGGDIQATGKDSLAIGLSTHATGDSAVAIGSNALATGQQTLAIGIQAIANGTASQAVGINASSVSASGLAIGNFATVNANSDSGVAIGSNSTVTGLGGMAVGGEATAVGTNAVAIGTLASATGVGSMVIGNNSTVDLDKAATTNTVVIGNSNSVTGTGTVVLGSNVKNASGNNSVVLGNGSDGSQNNVVSVGAKGSERKVVNVAAGSTTTDAVNYGQLMAAVGTGSTESVSYDTTAHDKVTFGGKAASTPVTLSNVAAGVTANDAVNMAQLAALGVVVDSTGKAQNAFVAYDSVTSKDTITLQGTSGSTKITKLTKGTLSAASTDAVNGSQLFNTASSTAAAIGGGAALDPSTGTISKPAISVGGTTYTDVAAAVTAAGTAATTALAGSVDAVKYDTSAHSKVTFGGTGGAVTLSNVAAGVTTTDAVNMGQLAALGVVVDSTGKAQNAFVAYDSVTSKDTITLKGTSGSTKITALTKGTLSAASTDAVNGSQLFNTASSTAAAIGGGAALDPTTGTISKPAISVGGTTYTDVAAAVTAAGTAATTALAGSVDAVKYDTSAHSKVTFGGTGGAVTLSNVAAGVTTTDAVNMGQLAALGVVVDSTGKAQNAFVAYDSVTSKDTITLKGTSGSTKITALTKGTLSAASTDAVNGSQLFNTASSAAAAIGGGAALDPTSGTISKPTIKVGDTTFDNLAGAVTAAAALATSGSTEGVVYDTTAHDKVTFNPGKTAATLSNVAAGVTTTDAVNMGQLAALGVVVDSTGKAQNAFVAYDSVTSKDTITLQGTSGSTKITKLTKGTLSAASTDAVNGSQLFNTASSTAAAIGGGAALDPSTGTISKPAISVGGTTYTDVAAAVTAAGTAATNANTGLLDAVKYDTSAHTKVTLGGTAAPVTVSNVAAGVSSNDAVNVAQFNAGISSITASTTNLNNAVKYIGFGPSLAAFANASGTDSMALGGNAFATADRALAVGLNARAGFADSVALGTNSVVSAANTVSVGSIGAERRIMNVAVGTKSTDAVNLGQVTKMLAGLTPAQSQQVLQSPVAVSVLSATALKASASSWTDVLATGDTDKAGQTQAVGTDAMAIGLNAHATDAQATAIGQNALATAQGSVAVGNGAISNGVQATAIGVNASVTGAHALSAGFTAVGDGDDSIAFGTDAYVGGAGSVAIGKDAVVTKAAPGSFVLGNATTVTGANTFVLGSNIEEVSGTNSVVLGSGSDGSQNNVVSVGAKGSERKIVNVAAGTTATDAVNLGQMTKAIADAGTGTGGGGDTYVTQPTAGGALFVGSATDGKQVNFGGTAGARELVGVANGKSSDSAATVGQLTPVVTALGGGAKVDATTGAVTGPTYNVQGGTQTTVGDALTSLDTGLTTVNTKIADLGPNLVTQAAAGSDLLVGSKTDGTHVNFAGTAGNRELINVAAGTTNTSAVNLSQLKPVVAGLGGGAAVDAAGNVTGPTYTIQGSTVNNAGDAFTKIDGNLTDLKTTVADIAGSTGNGLVIQDATTRAIKVAPLNDGTVVDVTGSAGARTITGVAAGSLDVSSLDAINGSQLNSATSSMATAIGGGMSVDSKTGAITMPSFKVGGQTMYNVGDAITGLDGRIDSTNNSLTELTTKVTNISAGGTGTATPNAVAYDTAAHDTLTLASTSGGTTKLSGLTDGNVAAGSTDAVTGNQLSEVKDSVTTLQTTVNNIAETGTTVIGVKGADGTNGINGADGVAGSNGTAASANGADAIAMGDNASASGDHAVVIGGGASGTGDGVIAIGGNSNASGKDSIAIGNGATAPAENAVALGANSVADRDNSVSVGSADQQRQITNVAAGTQGTDAVNLNQMNQAVGGIARKAYSGIAAATALTMIPDVDANKTLSIGIGGGTFQGYAATAIGGTARITQNIKVRVGAGWSAAGTTVGAGASYQW